MVLVVSNCKVDGGVASVVCVVDVNTGLKKEFDDVSPVSFDCIVNRCLFVVIDVIDL